MIEERPMSIRLYLDVDGVLLGRSRSSDCDIVLAHGALDFLKFVTGNFDCYWLTTHCDGDSSAVVDYLRPYCDEQVLELLKVIKPTTFDALKTEALKGDFYWLMTRRSHRRSSISRK